MYNYSEVGSKVWRILDLISANTKLSTSVSLLIAGNNGMHKLIIINDLLYEGGCCSVSALFLSVEVDSIIIRFIPFNYLIVLWISIRSYLIQSALEFIVFMQH